MAQINVIVGDIEGNARKIAEWTDRAIELQADVVTFPELALTGYPPEDLLLKPQFIDANMAAIAESGRTHSRHHGSHRIRRQERRHLQRCCRRQKRRTSECLP